MTYGLNEVEAVSLCEASEVKMEARFEIYLKFYIKYSFAPTRRDWVGHPTVRSIAVRYEVYVRLT